MKRLTLISSGEYSDYEVIAVVEWLSERTPMEALADFLAAHPEQKTDDYTFETHKFLADLLRAGLCVEVECQEFHVDSYGCVSYTNDQYQGYTWFRPVPQIKDYAT